MCLNVRNSKAHVTQSTSGHLKYYFTGTLEIFLALSFASSVLVVIQFNGIGCTYLLYYANCEENILRPVCAKVSVMLS